MIGWVIHTYDGGRDDLKPARWIAQVPNLRYGYVYGATEDEAVKNMKTLMATDYPNAHWFQTLPVKRMRG
jgi:hypothetical protein